MKEFDFVNRCRKDYFRFRNNRLRGRYISFLQLEPELERLGSSFEVKEIGRSVKDVPIHAVRFGEGAIKIFGWSQMHGNESTTTRALFDIFSLFSRKNEIKEIDEILEQCTFMFIPMLNPDGAERYSRENYNGVDLNRDANTLTQKESQVLRQSFDSFAPDFCFNLHDQRTLFSAGKFGKPATVSFLAPALDEARSLTKTREKAMKIIVAMNSALQAFLPGQVGRFDDSFNINCSGDRFQAYNVPTILFEAGHFEGDYAREETRKYIALAILAGFHSICSGAFEKEEIEDYNSIPENQKDYCDILLKNVLREGEIVDVSIQYAEKLEEGRLVFDPVVHLIQKNLPLLGHKIINCKGEEPVSLEGQRLHENVIVKGILLNRGIISFKIE